MFRFTIRDLLWLMVVVGESTNPRKARGAIGLGTCCVSNMPHWSSIMSVLSVQRAQLQLLDNQLRHFGAVHWQDVVLAGVPCRELVRVMRRTRLA
jgi:hypothetical protein